jgi:hypothetical protein
MNAIVFMLLFFGFQSAVGVTLRPHQQALRAQTRDEAAEIVLLGGAGVSQAQHLNYGP